MISDSAEPCLDHRRHPAVQGAALPLCQFRHGRAGGAAAVQARADGARLHPDRHRWRVLDGRLSGEAARDHGAGRPLRRAGDGGRLPRHRLHGAAGPRHAASCRGGDGRHPDRHARQGAWRRAGRLCRRAAAGDRPLAPARAALPVLQRPAAGRGRRRARRAGPGRGGRRPARAAVRQRPLLAGGAGRTPGSACCRASIRSCR